MASSLCHRLPVMWRRLCALSSSPCIVASSLCHRLPELWRRLCVIVFLNCGVVCVLCHRLPELWRRLCVIVSLNCCVVSVSSSPCYCGIVFVLYHRLRELWRRLCALPSSPYNCCNFSVPCHRFSVLSRKPSFRFHLGSMIQSSRPRESLGQQETVVCA